MAKEGIVAGLGGARAGTGEAAPGVGAAGACDVIRVSHKRNSRFGPSGAPVVVDGHFLQVLEGDGTSVRDRYARILADPRHTAAERRRTTQVSQLGFGGDWTALRHGSEIGAAVRLADDCAPGFPADRFDGDRLVAFAQACCATPAPERA